MNRKSTGQGFHQLGIRYLTRAVSFIIVELVSQSASAVKAPHIIMAIMVTHRLSIHSAQTLIDICKE